MPARLSPEEFGARLVPPISPQRVRILCAARRIPGARRTGQGYRASWSIPADAEDPRLPPGRPREVQGA
jgi:hypothetical protein